MTTNARSTDAPSPDSSSTEYGFCRCGQQVTRLETFIDPTFASSLDAPAAT